MAHLIPILQDILPIFRRGKVQVVRSTQLHEQDTGQAEGMIRKGAIVGMSDHICASVMIAKPHTSSAVHHHDTIIYAASGHGAIITNPALVSPIETPKLAPSRSQPVIDLPPSTSLFPSSTDPTETLTVLPASPLLSTESPIAINPSISTPLTAQSAQSIPNPTTTDPSFIHPSASNHSPSKGIQTMNLSPGDFALVPAWTEHQEINDSDEDVVWIISRSGSSPVVVNLEGWGGREI